MASELPARAAGDPRDLLTTDNGPRLSWEGSGTEENSGLAQVAAAEGVDADRLLETAHRLDLSPMYRLAVASMDEALTRLGGVSAARSEMEEFELRLFAARMWCGGWRAGNGGAR